MKTKTKYLQELKESFQKGELTKAEYTKWRKRAKYNYYYDIVVMANLKTQYPSREELEEALQITHPRLTSGESYILARIIEKIVEDPNIIAIYSEYLTNISRSVLIQEKYIREWLKEIAAHICPEYKRKPIIFFLLDIIESLDEEEDKSIPIQRIEQEIIDEEQDWV